MKNISSFAKSRPIYFATFFYILSSVVTIFFLNLYAIKSYKHKEGFNLVLYQFSHFPRKPAEVMRNPSWKMRNGARGRELWEAWETFEPRRDRHPRDGILIRQQIDRAEFGAVNAECLA